MSQNVRLEPHQRLTIRPQSQLYPGPYQTEVLAVGEGQATLAVPYHLGKVALLGVGTLLEVSTPDGGLTFYSEILDRHYTGNPYLVISLPYASGPRSSGPQVLAVTSGKGGVGKTHVLINLGIALAQLGQRVFLVDADLGTANVDVLLKTQAPYTLQHLVNREKDIMDIVVEGPGGIHVVPGGSGFQWLADLEEAELQRVVNSLQKLEAFSDYILIDTGAGLARNVINFVLAANRVIVVTTPEPHAMTDAYAIIKVISEHDPSGTVSLVVNRAQNKEEASQVAQRMTAVAKRFLNMDVHYLGYLPEDPSVTRAIRKMTPHLLEFPGAPAALAVKAIAQTLHRPAETPPAAVATTGPSSFFQRVRGLFARRGA